MYSYGKQNWHDNTGEECRAVRTRVGLFDQTSFAKFTVEGPDGAGCARPDQRGEGGRDPPAGPCNTQWCNDRGGI